MAYPRDGVEGSVTSWGSSNFVATLLAGMNPNSTTLNSTADIHDITALGATAEASLQGLAEWTVQIESEAQTSGGDVLHGSEGLVSTASGTQPYTTHSASWTLNMTTVEYDITEFAASPPVWKSFRPGKYWSLAGQYTARVDNSTGLTLPHLRTQTATTLTLKYEEETVADATIAGSALIQSVNEPMVRGSLMEATYAFKYTGAITLAGTNSPLGTGTLGAPYWDEGGANNIALAFTDGTTVWNGDAFPTAITLSVNPGSPVGLSVTARGTGSLS